MHPYRKILVLFVIFCGMAFVWFYHKSSTYFLVGQSSVEMAPYAQALADGLNHSPFLERLKHKDCANITIYPVNWAQINQLPDLSAQEKKCAILWYGSQQNLLDANLSEYYAVWASTPMLQSFLTSLHISALYVPTFSLDKKNFPATSQKYFAIIGELPKIKNILERHNLPFKQYDVISDMPSIRQDLPYWRAAFVQSTKINSSSVDIHPIFLEIALNRIPIFAPWIWPQEDTINLFNDCVSFYQDELDFETMLRNFLQNDNKFSERSRNAAKLVEREFTLQRNLERILAQNTNSDALAQFFSPAQDTVTISIPTAVGHYTAGDYALAQDLAHYLKQDMTSVDFVFYNSLYRYPSEINILFRGFLPPEDYNLKANYNILYLAYAQFAQNETQEMLPPFEDYLKTLQQSSQKVQALIVASQKISDALNARGIETYYIPQFTNTSRFYYDFDEKLKSEVLFVGMNNFYRTAVPALLKRGIKVDVYGPNWPQGIAKADYADNQILRKYYSSAKIVLNDTREGMKQFGFISNRIFDASACGTLVISDYMPEIEQIYGDSVPMYRSEDELYHLVKYYLTHDKERIEKAQKAQEITLRNFTAEKAAIQFIDIINQLKNK